MRLVGAIGAAAMICGMTTSGSAADFYAGKLAVANWFARNMLPELTARRAVIEAADTSLMDVPENAF